METVTDSTKKSFLWVCLWPVLAISRLCGEQSNSSVLFSRKTIKG